MVTAIERANFSDQETQQLRDAISEMQSQEQALQNEVNDMMQRRAQEDVELEKSRCSISESKRGTSNYIKGKIVMNATLMSVFTNGPTGASASTAAAYKDTIVCIPHVLSALIGGVAPYYSNLFSKGINLREDDGYIGRQDCIENPMEFPIIYNQVYEHVNCEPVIIAKEVQVCSYTWSYVTLIITIIMTLLIIRCWMKLNHYIIVDMMKIAIGRSTRACETLNCPDMPDISDAILIFQVDNQIKPVCGACAINGRHLTNDVVIGIKHSDTDPGICQVCKKEAVYKCPACSTYICFSIFESRDDSQCHDIHALMCQSTILGNVNARCLYGMIVLSGTIKNMMYELMKLLESSKSLLIPIMKQWLFRVIQWIQKNGHEIIMSTIIIFIELFLNTMTLAGELGIPPLSIGLGMSVLTLVCAPLMITAIVGTIVVYLLVALHSKQDAEEDIRAVTPKKRIQRRLDGWSPLGHDIQEDESDLIRLKRMIFPLIQRIFVNISLIVMCILLVYTLQGCDSGQIEGDDSEPIQWIVLAYTILTYTESMRLLITLVIGISIGYMYTRVHQPEKIKEIKNKNKNPQDEKSNKKQKDKIRISVIKEVLWKMKVTQLSEVCERLSIPKTGLKPDIVERIINHMKERLEPAHILNSCTT